MPKTFSKLIPKNCTRSVLAFIRVFRNNSFLSTFRFYRLINMKKIGISCLYPSNICWTSAMERRLNGLLCAECVSAYFAWMLGPTGCPGSVPDSGTETQPWPNCCHTEKNRKQKRTEVMFLQMHPGQVCYVVMITSLTPTPRLSEHMPPKYAALLLR